MGSEEDTKKEAQGGEGEGGKKEETVILSKEDYTDMVNKINSMEGAIKGFLEQETEKGEKAEQEKREQNAREEAARRGPAKDIDLMSNRELAGAILAEVEGRMAKPLLQMVSTLAVKDEKRDLERYCEKNGEDFEEYEEEVFKTATEKPTLSLMEAFKLVKAGRAPKAKEEKKEEEKKGPAGGGGEKPSGGKFQSGGKLTLEQAAKKAFEENKDKFND